MKSKIAKMIHTLVEKSVTQPEQTWAFIRNFSIKLDFLILVEYVGFLQNLKPGKVARRFCAAVNRV